MIRRKFLQSSGLTATALLGGCIGNQLITSSFESEVIIPVFVSNRDGVLHEVQISALKTSTEEATKSRKLDVPASDKEKVFSLKKDELEVRASLTSGGSGSHVVRETALSVKVVIVNQNKVEIASVSND